MKILAIETSCDETSCAIVENGRWVLANVIASQVDIHAKTGGVVPEVAAREHVLKMLPVLDECLVKAWCEWDDIHAIAVTKGPGLISSLIIGTETANVISFVKNKPLIPVQHIVGHIYSNWLEENVELKSPASLSANFDPHVPITVRCGQNLPAASHLTLIQRSLGKLDIEPKFPIIILTVSGGHNELILMRDHFDFEVLGETRDDAAGEAFDKVARILGLGYPGGPAISKIAEEGDGKAFSLPRSFLEKGSLDFSFSGLKTAVLNEVKRLSGHNYGGKEKFTGAGQTENKSVKSQIAQNNGLERVRAQDPGDKIEVSQFARNNGLEFTHVSETESKNENSQSQNMAEFAINSQVENKAGMHQLKADLAASFQEAVVEVLAEKLIMALRKFPEVKEVHLAGGVSANKRLREVINDKVEEANSLKSVMTESSTVVKKKSWITFRFPKSILYCTDNAAMIASAAYYLYKKNPKKFKANSNVTPIASFEI